MLLSRSLHGKTLLSRRGPTADAWTGRRVRWYSGKAFDPDQPRGDNGRFGSNDDAEDDTDEQEVDWGEVGPKQAAKLLFEAVGEVEGGDYEATCTAANEAFHQVFPHAKRFQGTYNGEDHEWAEINGKFVDVTASQFGGPEVLFSSDLPPEYEGEETDWTTLSKQDREKADKILAAAERLAKDRKSGGKPWQHGKALTVKRDAIGRRYCVDEVNGVMRRVPCGREGMEELNARRAARDKEAMDKAREAIDAYRRGDTLASEMLASLQGLTRDQLRGLRSSMGLDKRGDSLKRDLADKINKAALATLEVRHLEPYGDKDKVGIDEPSVGNSEKPGEAPKPFPTSWSKTSSSRSVDAYRVGNVLKINGQWGVVTGYKRTMDDHGGFRHTLSLRPANEEEAKQGRIGELKSELRAMSPGPDDDRDRAKHAARQKELDNEIRRLEGRPSVEEERAAIVAERRADFENAWTNGDVYDRLQHIQAVANRPGAPLHNRTSWSNLAEKTGIPAEKLMSVFDKEQKFTDDELNKIATAAGITLDQLKYGIGHVPHDDPKFTGIAANGIYYKDGVPQKKAEEPTPNAPTARVDAGPAHSVPGLVSTTGAEKPGAGLTGMHKEDFDKLASAMTRQINAETSASRRAIVAVGLMSGESPAVQAALAQHLKEIAPDAAAYLADNPQATPIGLRDLFKGSESPPKPNDWDRIRAERAKDPGVGGLPPDPRVAMRIKRVQELIARADAKARDGGLSKATRERNAGDAAKLREELAGLREKKP